MSIQWPAFSEFWVFAGFLIGMLAAASYIKGALYQGARRFWESTLCWGAFIALIGLWPLLATGVGYTHPLGSLSAGIVFGFLALTVGPPVVGFVLLIIILLGHLIVENIPPRTRPNTWS